MIIDLFLILLLIALLCATAFWTYLLVYMLWYKVPLISTAKNVTFKALELAEIKPNQQVLDLGCGWSPFLFAAAKKEPQTHYTGYDVLTPVLWINRWRAKNNITFVRGDFFKADLSEADVIYCYLWDTIMADFYIQKWPSLKKGVRVISYDFPLKKLKPVKTVNFGKSTLYLYVKN